MPSQVHSAHIGQDVEVHYRWHPFYGRRLRAQYSEQRGSGRVVHVEVAPGVVTVLPDWMLDASICAGMTLGAPRVSTSALGELQRLLVACGFRRSSGDCLVTQESRDELHGLMAEFGVALPLGWRAMLRDSLLEQIQQITSQLHIVRRASP